MALNLKGYLIESSGDNSEGASYDTRGSRVRVKDF